MFVEVQENYSLKNLTSFKIGGDAENIYYPKTINEFVYLLKILDSPHVMGNWSNVLVSSNGVSGNIISTSFLDKIEINGNKIYAQCGVKGQTLSSIAAQNGLSGFEFMSGFPGSIGGNIYMHASACKQSISDKLLFIDIFDLHKKNQYELPKSDLNFSYRTSILQKMPIITLGAHFELEEKKPSEIQKTINENLKFRKLHQPNLSIPNVGSIFKNPDGYSAGELLDSVGAKKFSQGGAKVWDKHANFIVNPNKNATSSDVLELMFKMYNAVYEKYSIKLKPEIKILGNLTEREEYICVILYSPL